MIQGRYHVKWHRSPLSGLSAAAVALVIASPAWPAPEWPRLPADMAEGATVWNPSPQWPNIAPGAVETKPARAAARPATAPPLVAAPDTTGSIESREPPAVAAPETMGSTEGSEPPVKPVETTGAFLEPRPRRAEPPVLVEAPLVPVPVVFRPFVFEVGGRYWYSTGKTKFGFTNGNPSFGDPTSTLDWNETTGNAGEFFGRVDHRPTGLFAKGVIGGGVLDGGTIIDRDFLAGQIKFSDTSSQIKGDNLFYGMIDLGWGLDVPAANIRLGGFVGYHYWREKKTAFGLTCNPDDVGGVLCGPPGTVLYTNATAVLAYQPTWQALRLGFEGRYQITPNWSVAGEAAFIPVAWLENKDSHLLRQSMDDLGPAPNIISRSKRGYGAEAELFVNYAFTDYFEIGIGGRYWSLTATKGSVTFGPGFSTDYALTRFDQDRFGLVIQAKGRF
jgi:hypothetical protein